MDRTELIVAIKAMTSSLESAISNLHSAVVEFSNTALLTAPTAPPAKVVKQPKKRQVKTATFSPLPDVSVDSLSDSQEVHPPLQKKRQKKASSDNISA